jgi:sugar transferase EpsL
MSMAQGSAKRLTDFVLSGVGLLILSPVLLVLSVCVRLSIGAPVLFRQRRPGFKGEPFLLLKFRTMTDGTDENGRPLPDEKRMTRFGHLLRHTSLDELPELVNVFKGEMSLVGPRPLLMEYLPLYSAEQARRHEVKPGITGWAQVNGRNAISWEDKFKLDVWYVDHQSMWVDVKILAKTILAVVLRDGVSQSGCATMPKFMGTK